jgi:CheY-like chemotaxis protein
VKFVLCDDDALMRNMVETLIERQGHELIAAVVNTADATDLIVKHRPDAVIVDLSLGYNTDFDIVDVATAVGSQVIVFSHNADQSILSRFTPTPITVAKPDFVQLEEVLGRVKPNEGPGGGAEIQERRRHPDRVSIGPVPTGLADAHAFYEALSNAMPDDVLLSVEPAGPGALVVEADAALVSRLVRATDRVLFAGSSIKLYLADGGTDGTAVFLARLREVAPILADQVRVRSVTLGDGELSSDAFDRLKGSTEVHHP